MSFSPGRPSGILGGVMPARAMTALFLLLVAAGHQPTERSVAQVQAAWILREAATERSALQSSAGRSSVAIAAPVISVLRSPAPKRRRQVMAGDLPAPRAPDA